MDQIERLTRRCARERAARKQAEELLEQKSLELYQLNQDLIERENTSRSILEATADGIIILDESGRIEMFNRAAQMIFFYSEAVAIGRNIEELLDLADSELTFSDYVEASILEPTCALLEMIGIRSDGSSFPIELTISKADLSERAMIIVSVRDITKRREAEAEWSSMEIQLHQALKLEAIGQLAAGIAHEINTPIQFVGDNTRFFRDSFIDLERLATVRDRLMAAARQGSVPVELIAECEEIAEEIDFSYLREEIPQAVEQTLEGIERVAGIVRAMNEFSHPGVEEKTSIDINAAIQSTVTVSRNEWKYVAELEVDLDPDLPLVPCFPGDFNQVILNIVVNAAHAIRDASELEGADKGLIRIATRRKGDWVQISISDTGTGMPEEVRSRIFDPFFTTKKVGQGTGQGLAIVYSVVVDKHSGSIEVESQMGKGTTFVIRLPMAQ